MKPTRRGGKPNTNSYGRIYRYIYILRGETVTIEITLNLQFARRVIPNRKCTKEPRNRNTFAVRTDSVRVVRRVCKTGRGVGRGRVRSVVVRNTRFVDATDKHVGHDGQLRIIGNAHDSIIHFEFSAGQRRCPLYFRNRPISFRANRTGTRACSAFRRSIIRLSVLGRRRSRQ